MLKKVCATNTNLRSNWKRNCYKV
uniref:Putative disease resistance protein RGA3 n=1 Tax=Rhizophora mucronata TaxID=61149 RepID=A0A2P2MKX7_RHIMU